MVLALLGGGGSLAPQNSSPSFIFIFNSFIFILAQKLTFGGELGELMVGSWANGWFAKTSRCFASWPDESSGMFAVALLLLPLSAALFFSLPPSLDAFLILFSFKIFLYFVLT